MQIEIWSDIVCPWCYIGKRRLESALAGFGHGKEITVTWRSFELDPSSPPQQGLPLDEHLAEKYGMSLEEAQAANVRMTELAAAEGLDYHLEGARGANSFDAHRLIHLAATQGLQGEMKERLMRAHFTENLPIGDRETLVGLAEEVGVGKAPAMLAGEGFTEEVRRDEETARSFNIGGVPFFLFEGKWGLSGAQPTEVFAQALEQVWGELHPAP